MTNTIIFPRRIKDTEAAERLGLSVKTLRQWRRTGGGPAFLKLGNAVRYDVDALEAWAASRVNQNTSQYQNARR